MKKESTYLIILAAVVSAIVLIFNSLQMRWWTHIKMELNIAKAFFIIGFIGLIIFWSRKKKTSILFKISLISLLVSLAFNIRPFIKYYEYHKGSVTIEKYLNIKSDNKIKQQFYSDLENDNIKYFQFGIGVDIGLKETLKENYNIQSFGMGCMVESNLNYYNKLVEEEYLKKKYHKSIDEIYKEVEPLIDIDME